MIHVRRSCTSFLVVRESLKAFSEKLVDFNRRHEQFEDIGIELEK